MDPSILYILDESICHIRGVWLISFLFLYSSKDRYHISYVNSIDTDQTLQYAVSDLSLHCLQMSLLYMGKILSL